MKIVGRLNEQAELKRYFDSGKPEFIAITGRRRVGKTYLIKELFAEDIVFYFTGVVGKNISNAYQLRRFDETIAFYGGKDSQPSMEWADAFNKLKKLLKEPSSKRQVIFIDELPWLDAPKSDFLPALDLFWNSFASSRPDIMLVICGSAASWIERNIFENKGGLHNRVTGRLKLAPFSLSECEAFFNELGVVMNRYQIAETYMVFGGIPYYLNMFEKSLGPTQNTDRLLFAENAPLRNEFNEIFSSLFRASNRHTSIVCALSKTASGLTRDEIIKAANIPGGGNLSRTLLELEECGFIKKYTDFTKPKNDACYRLIDPFVLYWLKYVKDNNAEDEYYWTNLIDDGKRRAWSGYAFEQLCLRHIPQIKHKLGISGLSTEVFSWRSKNSSPGAQIDLLISRRDEVLNLCEIKFSLNPITITKKDEQLLQQKRTAFLSETGCRKAIHMTMITTYGLTEKGYRNSIQAEVTLDDLFAR